MRIFSALLMGLFLASLLSCGKETNSEESSSGEAPSATQPQEISAPASSSEYETAPLIPEWKQGELPRETISKVDFNSPAELQAAGKQEMEEFLLRKQAEGWQILRENPSRDGGTCLLRKPPLEELSVTIGTRTQAGPEGKEQVIFTKLEPSRRIPRKEIAGFEPEDVPRYPNSTRIRWRWLLGDFTAKYLSTDPIDQVKTFFEKELPQLNWEFQGMQAGKMAYVKAGAKPGEIPSTLNIILSENDGITEIGFGRSSGEKDDLIVDGNSVELKAGFKVNPERVLTRVDVGTDIPFPEGATPPKITSELFKLQAPEVTVLNSAVPMGPIRDNAEDLRSFYLREMKARGWELEKNAWWNNGGTLEYRKGSVTATVAIRDDAKRFVEMENIPPSAPKEFPVEVTVLFPIPSRDLAGEDIPNVPRYPDAVRDYFIKAAMSHGVRYKVAGTSEMVYEWYLRELPKHGWQCAGISQEDILFTPGGSPESAMEAFSTGAWVPTTLSLTAKDNGWGVVTISFDQTKGDN